MAVWYAQYRTSDNKVTAAGFVESSLLEKEDHAVSAGQSGSIPKDLREKDGTLNYQYNTETQAVEPVA
jgi:hypothetical protein